MLVKQRKPVLLLGQTGNQDDVMLMQHSLFVFRLDRHDKQSGRYTMMHSTVFSLVIRTKNTRCSCGKIWRGHVCLR
jgi:cytochrome oxidase Cu insertion factor (SCO1/SenC/PrrC family)